MFGPLSPQTTPAQVLGSEWHRLCRKAAHALMWRSPVKRYAAARSVAIRFCQAAAGGPPPRTAALRSLLLAVVIVALCSWCASPPSGPSSTAAGVRQAIQGAGAPGVAGVHRTVRARAACSCPRHPVLHRQPFAYGRGWSAVVRGGAGNPASVVRVFVRAIGGQPLAVVEAAWLRRLLSKLDQRPFATVFLLRTILMAAPAVNYSLALSSLRFPLYFAGSAAGLAVPLVVLWRSTAYCFIDHRCAAIRSAKSLRSCSLR